MEKHNDNILIYWPSLTTRECVQNSSETRGDTAAQCAVQVTATENGWWYLQSTEQGRSEEPYTDAMQPRVAPGVIDEEDQPISVGAVKP